MKIMNWNIEWMNRWFTGNKTPVWGTRLTPSDTRGLTPDEARATAARVAGVINAEAPDLLCIQEGPSSIEEMELFIADFLSDGAAPLFEPLIGFDGSSQKLYALRRIDGRIAAMEHATDPHTLALREVWDADVNGDMMLEAYDFTRLPLVVDIDPDGGLPIRVVILHTKSKHVQFGKSKFENPATRQSFIVEALEARRRISAEGFRLRGYLDALLEDDPTARIIVTGDFNDGPGRDLFERSYLTHSVTDILLGWTFYPDLIFDHPLIRWVETPALFTARFDDYVDDIQDRPLLLDHFIVSPSMKDQVEDAGIAHASFEDHLETSKGHRSQRPSDHRPIWVEIGAPLTG